MHDKINETNFIFLNSHYRETAQKRRARLRTHAEMLMDDQLLSIEDILCYELADAAAAYETASYHGGTYDACHAKLKLCADTLAQMIERVKRRQMTK